MQSRMICMQWDLDKNKEKKQKINLLCLRNWLDRNIGRVKGIPLAVSDRWTDDYRSQKLKEKAERILETVLREIKCL